MVNSLAERNEVYYRLSQLSLPNLRMQVFFHSGLNIPIASPYPPQGQRLDFMVSDNYSLYSITTSHQELLRALTLHLYAPFSGALPPFPNLRHLTVRTGLKCEQEPETI